MNYKTPLEINTFSCEFHTLDNWIEMKLLLRKLYIID